MEKLVELKAKAYDLIFEIQQKQIELNNVNKEMQDILKEENKNG